MVSLISRSKLYSGGCKMNVCRKYALLAVFMAVGVAQVSWSENVAVLVNNNLFEIPLDPINIPDDKAFLLESIELLQPGIFSLITHLENDLGHTANIYSSGDDDPGVVEDNNDLIIVTESLGSGSIGSDYAVTNKPFIATEFFIIDDMGVASASEFTGAAFNEGSVVAIADPNHPIAQGLPESFSITVDDPETGMPENVTFGVVRTPSILSGGTVVATLPTSNNASDSDAALTENVPVVIALEAGDVGNDTRWAFIGYSDVNLSAEQGGDDDLKRTLSLLNENGIALLDNTIAWALGQEPATVDSWSLY